MSEPMDFDEILQQEAKREADARMTAKFAPLWEAAEAALRSDLGLVIELAEEVHRVIAFEQDRAARSERARQASALGVAARSALKAERTASECESGRV